MHLHQQSLLSRQHQHHKQLTQSSKESNWQWILSYLIMPWGKHNWTTSWLKKSAAICQSLSVGKTYSEFQTTTVEERSQIKDKRFWLARIVTKWTIRQWRTTVHHSKPNFSLWKSDIKEQLFTLVSYQNKCPNCHGNNLAMNIKLFNNVLG